MNKLLSLAIPLFFLMDFIGTVPVFIFLTKEVDKKERTKIAILASLAAGLIVFVFAILGNSLLSYFNLSIEAVKVGGGLLLLYIAFEMILSGQLFYEKAKDIRNVIISPLAIPMLAGPGSMTFAMIKFIELAGVERIYLFLAIVISVLVGALVLSLSSLIP